MFATFPSCAGQRKGIDKLDNSKLSQKQYGLLTVLDSEINKRINRFQLIVKLLDQIKSKPMRYS